VTTELSIAPATLTIISPSSTRSLFLFDKYRLTFGHLQVLSVFVSIHPESLSSMNLLERAFAYLIQFCSIRASVIFLFILVWWVWPQFQFIPWSNFVWFLLCLLTCRQLPFFDLSWPYDSFSYLSCFSSLFYLILLLLILMNFCLKCCPSKQLIVQVWVIVFQLFAFLAIISYSFILANCVV